VIVTSVKGGKLSSLPLRGAVEAAWSPRGDRIALGLRGGSGEDTIRLLSVAADGALSETASFPGSNPSWRPDGGALVFVRANLVWRADGDGSNAAALATVPVDAGDETRVQRPTWDPQGEAIAFAVTRSHQGANRRQELWLLRGDSSVMIYSEDAATEFALSPERWSALPAWTADGRLLFSSDRGGAPQAWSIRPDGSDLRSITPPGAIWSALATDWLYFVRLDSETPLWKVSADGSDLVPLAWKN
jgi:Tol biopolymer transport system component